MSKKKTRRRRSAGGGAQAQQRREERLEARRQARAEADLARQRAATRQKWIRRGLIAALAVIVTVVLIARQAPQSIAGHEVETFSSGGVGSHTTGSVSYDSRPPVAGLHDPTPEPCGTHAQPVDPEKYVHSLEHGAVAILYKPDQVPPEDVARIESIVGDYDENVLSSPYTDMDTEIAVTSWGEMIRLNGFEEDAIRDYIDAFAGQGPESGQNCPNDLDESFTPPGDGDR